VSKLISLPIPATFISSLSNQTQINTVNLSNSSDSIHHHHQILSFAPTSSSAAASSSSSSSSSKQIINLINDSTDMPKNIRKFTLNTQHQVANLATNSLASSSSSASSSAPSFPPTNTGASGASNSSSSSSSNSSNLPFSSSGECLSNEKHEKSNDAFIKEEHSITNNSTTINTATRKKRKQEFRIKNNDELTVNFSNNPFYPNRYLYENTNISNANNINKKSNKSINRNCKNDLKNGDYFVDETTVSSLEEDEPNSKQARLSDLNSTTKTNKLLINNNHRKKFESNSKIDNMDSIKEESNLINDENSAETNNNNTDQIEVVEEQEEEEEENITCLDDETVKLLSKEFSYVASNGVKWVSKKRSSISFSKTWNPCKHHFVHY